MGVQVGADAAQKDGSDVLDLRDCTHYGAPVVGVAPVPLFVERVDHVGPVWWQGGLSRDNVPQALSEEGVEVHGEVVLRLRSKAVVPRGFVFPEAVNGLPDFVDGEGAFLQLPPLGVAEDLGGAFDFVLGVCVPVSPGWGCAGGRSCPGWPAAPWPGCW